MRNLKVLLPASLVVAVTAGLSGCGSAGSTNSGAAGAAAASSVVAATSSASSASPAAGGIDDPVHGWKGSSKESNGTEGSCAWLTKEQIKGVLGDLAPNLSAGFYTHIDYSANDVGNPGGAAWTCYANLGPVGSRYYVARRVFKDVAHAANAVSATLSPVPVPGLGEEAYNLLSLGPAGFWRILAVRTGTTVVNVALRIGSDPKDETQVPDRIDQLKALYRLLPTP